MARISWARAASIVTMILAGALTANASDFYAKAEFGSHWGKGKAEGEFNIVGTGPAQVDWVHRGSDWDTSPRLAFAGGLEVPLPEALPWNASLPEWKVRMETELSFLADFDFKTRTKDSFEDPDPDAEPPLRDATTFFHNTQSKVTWMNSFFLDMPVYRPAAMLYGPVSILKPVSFYVGTGVGMSYLESMTIGPAITIGKNDGVSFSWQVSSGFSYALSRRVDLSVGYRYTDYGHVKVTMRGNGLDPNDSSTHAMNVTSHGFDAGIRVKFYSTDFPQSVWDWMVE